MRAAEAFFVDTNVFLYSLDPRNPFKQEAARHWVQALWHSGAGRTSWQVLNEFYRNGVRKLPMPPPDLRTEVETMAQWQPVGFGLGVLQRAWHWTDRVSIDYWDSLIVAAAETAGCRYLLSEDFQRGQEFGGVTVISPFHSSPEQFGLA